MRQTPARTLAFTAGILLGCNGVPSDRPEVEAASTRDAPEPVGEPAGLGETDAEPPESDVDPPSGAEARAAEATDPEPNPWVAGKLVLPVAGPASNPVEQSRRTVFDTASGELVVLGDGRQWVWNGVHLEVAGRGTVDAEGAVFVDGTKCMPTKVQQATAAAYDEVCPGLYRRNPVAGRRSKLEWGADFLRDHVRGGEAVTDFVKTKVKQDKGRRVSRRGVAGQDDGASKPRAIPVVSPTSLVVEELGLPVSGAPEALAAGRFHAVAGAPDVWISALTPDLVAGTNPLDRTEADADVLLVLFDLDVFTMDYALGTDHPRLGWADRVAATQKDKRAGPDGFEESGPLVRTGAVPPDRANLVVSTFTAGFKRSHGAFHKGELAERNKGSHFGFVEEGVVYSRPQPGLATTTVGWEGDIDVFTWSASHETQDYRHVRQNGAPLVENGKVGSLVSNLREGNWSGSVEGNARSMRGGLCVRQGDRSRELLYGYFTNASPATMARVFLAAGCENAMLLDMNALEHTYLAVYTRDPQLRTHNLDTGMAVLDLKAKDGTLLPRFLALPDNRDFFSVRRK